MLEQTFVFTAVAFLQRCPKATVLEAMKMGGFSEEEIYDRAKQAWIYRRFGCEEEHLWPVTFGVNEKGGMDDHEFADYIMNSIVPLYPHAKDKRGH